ncbi:TPA: hypothetical protein NJZ05_002844 [Vibrio parahaemolyticus]|nr:hypothetical protein [Vibrio parahaemolyticus]
MQDFREERDHKDALDELAILVFTNDGEYDRLAYQDHIFNDFNSVVLTGKESYFWAVAISILVERFEYVTEESILEAYEVAINKNIELLRQKYCAPKLNFYSEINDRHIFESILKDFLDWTDCHQVELDEIVDRTQKAFDRLISKGLIEDPLEIAAGTLAVGVLGFIPYGFTTKTRRGRVVYRKITAGYWSYESRYKNGLKETNLNFRLVKLLAAFKKALIEVAQDSIDDPEI